MKQPDVDSSINFFTVSLPDAEQATTETAVDEETVTPSVPRSAMAGSTFAAGSSGSLGTPSGVMALADGFLISYGFSELHQYSADGVYI